MADSDPRISLLGGFRLVIDRQAVAPTAWRLRKAQSVVKLLALAPNYAVHRDHLMDVLWPDSAPEAAANNLYQAVHAARRALGTAVPSAARWLAQEGDRLALRPGGPVWVDVVAFEQAGAAARRTGDLAAYRTALAAYTGELLPEDRYEDWAASRREAVRGLFLALLAELAEREAAQGETMAAIATLQRLVTEEPTDEASQRRLMRLYALTGRRAQALRQYQQLRAVLHHDLATTPEPATDRLYARILASQGPSEPEPAEPAPPAATAAMPVGTLPVPLTRFIGRERELADLRQVLGTTRLLTLTGTGGVGKTRLALALAEGARHEYPDGVWLVELAALADPVLVPGAVAAALGPREETQRPVTDTLIETLQGRATLLVLDNCEHLVEAVARLVATLLGACPRVRVLATSRAALRVPGELAWRVPSLAMPDSPAALTVEQVAASEAVGLFVDRARLVQPSFALSRANAAAVVEVCRHLDGIPLAIELAAAQLRALTVEQVAGRLDDSLGTLASGGRTVPPRHQTLWATLDWSYGLLGEPARALLRRLSVFVGGWTLAAAEAICAPDGAAAEPVLGQLVDLVDQSLVQVDVSGAEARYHLLETVRQYASEHLADDGDMPTIRRHHALLYLTLAEQAEAEWFGPRQPEWLRRLGEEHANLRAALHWLLDNGEAEASQRLAGALRLYWELRGHLVEGRHWLDRALSIGGPAVPPPVRAKALHCAGTLAAFQADYGHAAELLEASLLLWRAIQDRRGEARVLFALGQLAESRRDGPLARSMFAACLGLVRVLDDRQGIRASLIGLGGIALDQGDYAAARPLYEEALALNRELGNPHTEAVCLMNLALAAHGQGDLDRAVTFGLDGLTRYQHLGAQHWIAPGLGVLAMVAQDCGHPELSVRLFGAAEAVNEGIGATFSLDQQALFAPRVAAISARLGATAFAAAWAAGRALALDDAIAAVAALRDECECDTKKSAADSVAALTRREREVAGLIARGLTNRQIAAELVLGKRTVDTHVLKLLQKLGTTSRAQIAAWVAKQGLSAAVSA